MTAHTNSALNTGTFTNVSLLPIGWSDADIGAPGLPGGAIYSAGTWQLIGGGADIYGTSDQFHYATRDFAGDGALVARVTSIGNTDAAAKAGVMMRSSISAGSRYAFVFVTPSGSVWFQTRATTDAAATTIGSASATAPVWVKLTRSGTTLAGWWSTDGTNWNSLGSQTISMSGTPKAGLAVTAHDDTKLNTSTFTNVSLTLFTGWESWQYQHFTPAQLGNSSISSLAADANADGVNNLLAYTAGLSPWVLATPANGGRPAAGAAGGKLAITFTRNTAGTDLTLTVQGADAPGGPWTDLARSTAGGAFTALVSGATAAETGTGTLRTVEVRDAYLMSDPAHPRRFLRLRSAASAP